MLSFALLLPAGSLAGFGAGSSEGEVLAAANGCDPHLKHLSGQ